MTFYDSETGERTKQIDVIGRTHNGIIPHTHIGYVHDEHGTRPLTQKEVNKVNSILRFWENKRKQLNM